MNADAQTHDVNGQPIDQSAAWCDVTGVAEQCRLRLADIVPEVPVADAAKVESLIARLVELGSLALSQWKAIEAAETLGGEDKLDREHERCLRSQSKLLMAPADAWIEASLVASLITELAEDLADSPVGRRVGKMASKVCEAVNEACPYDEGPTAYLTIRQSAEFCACTPRTIRNRLSKVNSDGTPMLAGVKGTGRLTRIPQASLEPFRKQPRTTKRKTQKHGTQKRVKRSS